MLLPAPSYQDPCKAWEGESSSGEMSNFHIDWMCLTIPIKDTAHHFAFTWAPRSFKTSTIYIYVCPDYMLKFWERNLQFDEF